MTRSPLSIVGVVIVAAVLLGGVVQLQAIRERDYPPATGEQERLNLQSGTAIRRMTGPLKTLSADIYWIRAIQHYGGTKRRLLSAFRAPAPPLSIVALTTDEYPLLYPLLDITTTLDPRFKIAYRFGAIFLAEPYPTGPGRPDLAQALLEKGIRAQPDKWEYMQDIGFMHYWYRHDYHTAAEWFHRASEVPGAPVWLRPLAAATLAQGGDRRSSRLMWRSILEGAEVAWLRQNAEQRLAQLDALDMIDQLQRMVDGYAARAGRTPTDWFEMIRARVIPGVPQDPTRVPFVLGPDGRVWVSERSPLSPLPEEPQDARRPS